MNMYQGEFIEKVLAGTLSEPDVRAFINSQPKEDLPGLLTFIHDKQGAIVAEGMFKDDCDFFNLQWKGQFEKLLTVAELVRDRMNTNNIQRTLPDFLTERGIKAFDDAIEYGLIDKDSFAWRKSNVALGRWLVDVCSVGGVTTKMAYGRKNDWVSFERFFSKKGLENSYNKGEVNNCRDYSDELSAF